MRIARPFIVPDRPPNATVSMTMVKGDSTCKQILRLIHIHRKRARQQRRYHVNSYQVTCRALVKIEGNFAFVQCE